MRDTRETFLNNRSLLFGTDLSERSRKRQGNESDDLSFSFSLFRESEHLRRSTLARALTGSFPRKRNKNDGETLSSQQVIPDISLSLVALPIFPSSRERANEEQQRGTRSPTTPLRHRRQPPRATSSRGLNGCRTDCFLFRTSVPRPLFPRVAAPRGNDKQMSAVV